MSQLVIWGAGGHGKVVCDVARATGIWSKIIFIDDGVSTPRIVNGAPVGGDSTLLAALAEQEFDHFIVAIGNNQMRAECFRSAHRYMMPATLIHPSAVVSKSATIGAGCVVMPGAVINASAEIGPNCIINTSAIVEHDCKIGSHVHISPGATLGGAAQVDDYAQVGLGALILPGCAVGAGALIGAGGVVTRSIPAGITAIGIPARALARA